MLETQQWTATIGTTDAIILGTSQGRRRITFSPPSVGRVTIAFGRAAVLDQGFTMPAGVDPVSFDYDDWGTLIQGEIHAIADAAGRTFGGIASFKAGA